MRKPLGFTLIELLVVMAMVGGLVSLLLPALGRAKSHAKNTACLNHLRQWGVATHLFVVDNDDYLPHDGAPNPGPSSTNLGWYVELPRQISLTPYHLMPWRTNPLVDPGRSIWLCPANTRRSNGNNLFHYCLNQHVNGSGPENQPVRLTTLRFPTVTVWLFDSKNLPAVGAWSFAHTNLHQQGAQFLFLEGHAARFANTDYWDFPAGQARTNHPGLRWMP